ncbi:MAG: hypothetical protein KDJ44_12530 [Rhodoblastus sp.]|nr:hypothetical protein [Rhodoblastus sp.]
MYEINPGSARWASPSKFMLSVEIKGDGETEWRRCTISKSDPSADFAAIFEQVTAEPPAFGAIADCVEPAPVEASNAIPPNVLPPVVETPPVVLPPPPPINWDDEAARFIAAIYTVNGQSVRSSMNVWAAAVALMPEANRDQFDTTCAEMVPALNDWEGLVFAERDRLKALETSAIDDAQWPVLPDGAPQFIQWCAQP